MVRIKTILKDGKEFLSPFVFTKEQAEKKISSTKRWHQWRGWPMFELVSVDKFHPLTEWKEDHPIFDQFVSNHIELLKQLENTWKARSD
jgi:hypothetical protein